MTKMTRNDELSKEQRESIRDAIVGYRSAWMECVSSEEFREGVLPATVSEDDSPAAWRAYEQDKRVRKAEERLIEVLDSFSQKIPAVRHQGVVYSVREAKSTEIGAHRLRALVEKVDDMLNLDWPTNVPEPELPAGPKTWEF